MGDSVNVWVEGLKVNELLGGWVSGSVGRRMGGWMDGRMGKWMGHGCVWVDAYGWVGRWMNGCGQGGGGGWVGGRVDG